MPKYNMTKNVVEVDGEVVAKWDIEPGELNLARLQDMICAANRGVSKPSPEVAQAPVTSTSRDLPPGLINDLDEGEAAAYLVQHCVPFIGPEIGIELIKIVKRLEVVSNVYPLPETLETYRVAIRLLLQIAAKHQSAFCTMMERVLADDAA